MRMIDAHPNMQLRFAQLEADMNAQPKKATNLNPRQLR